MKIVVLDGYTLNPGDLSWDALAALGEFVTYDRTAPDEILERAQAAEILLTNKTVLDQKTLDALPDLKYIGVLATGYNVVDTDFARERGILVTNVPAYSSYSVVQMVFALLFELSNQVGAHSHSVRQGGWAASVDFSYTLSSLREMQGKVMGIVGYGNIGRLVAQAAQAFGMTVKVHTRTIPEEKGNIDFCSLETLLGSSDVISLHCPLTQDTEKLINRESLNRIPATSYLINTGRGPLVDEQALADALNQGTLAGAGLDVLSQEAPEADNPLLRAKNCFITPHIAWATYEARTRLLDVATDNVRAFLDGKMKNVVN